PQRRLSRRRAEPGLPCGSGSTYDNRAVTPDPTGWAVPGRGLHCSCIGALTEQAHHRTAGSSVGDLGPGVNLVAQAHAPRALQATDLAILSHDFLASDRPDCRRGAGAHRAGRGREDDAVNILLNEGRQTAFASAQVRIESNEATVHTHDAVPP